jgi:hypothetical protein
VSGVLLLTGCQNLPPPEVIEPAPPVRPVRLKEPLDGGVGRVMSVNERLRFVLLDYSLNRLPKIGDVVELWREDRVIGELKVTGPIRNTTVLADVVSGEPQVGDQARPKREVEKTES